MGLVIHECYQALMCGFCYTPVLSSPNVWILFAECLVCVILEMLYKSQVELIIHNYHNGLKEGQCSNKGWSLKMAKINQ